MFCPLHYLFYCFNVSPKVAWTVEEAYKLNELMSEPVSERGIEDDIGCAYGQKHVEILV